MVTSKHNPFRKEYETTSTQNDLISRVSHSEGSHQRHQQSLHEDINEALSKRSFDNEELELILEVIKNADSFIRVLSVLKSCG